MFKKVLLLDSIRSMQNVGAIFRSADGAGFEAIYLCGFSPYPMRGEISKTALGAEKTVFWEYYESSKDIIEKLKSQGFTIVCLEITPTSIDYKKFAKNISGPICIVLGNEVSGVSQSLQDASNAKVMIPMKGIKTSLNVSVAASIIMYEFLDY